MAFPIDKAWLVAVFVESILYGLYILLFLCTVYVLVYKRSSPRIHVGMLLATLLLFALATIHLVVNFLRLLEAFHLETRNPAAAQAFFYNPSTFKNLFQVSALFLEVITGDIVLVYRCYVAWGESIRIIIAPIVSIIATIVCSCGTIYTVSKLDTSAHYRENHKLQAFITSTQVTVLANNIFCTGLLSWRLWHMSRTMVSNSQRKALRSVAMITAQSGLIIAITWIIFIIVFAARSTAESIVRGALAPITGCAFCLIISRVALGLDSETGPTAHNGMLHASGDALSMLEPVLDGAGRPHRRPVEITVSSRQSVRVEKMVELPYKNRKVLEGLAIL